MNAMYHLTSRFAMISYPPLHYICYSQLLTIDCTEIFKFSSFICKSVYGLIPLYLFFLDIIWLFKLLHANAAFKN